MWAVWNRVRHWGSGLLHRWVPEGAQVSDWVGNLLPWVTGVLVHRFWGRGWVLICEAGCVRISGESSCNWDVCCMGSGLLPGFWSAAQVGTGRHADQGIRFPGSQGSGYALFIRFSTTMAGGVNAENLFVSCVLWLVI